MPNRAKSFASALLGGVIVTGVPAALVPLSLSVTASVAGECLESPNERTTQPGHWYFHFDRTLNRRCWFFQPSEARSSDAKSSEATAGPSAAAAPPATNQDSLLSRITAGFSQGLSPLPQQQQYVPPQAGIPDEAGDAARASPKPPKAGRVSRREQPQTAAPPTTSGAARVERSPDQPQQPASGADKDERPAAPVNVAEREALFQDFIKWQRDRTVFGFGANRW
jgi:hypothetical protein